jgi:hypothetical protein
MPDLPETREDWRARHRRIAEKNLRILCANGLRFEVRKSPDGLLGASALFREPGKPRVDFYLSTGRWRVGGASASRTMRGGARGFVAWYARRNSEVRRAR